MNLLKIIGIAAGAALVGAAGISAVAGEGNSAETSENPSNVNLKTRHYQANLQTFADEAGKIIPTLTTYGQNWKLTASEITEKSAIIKVEVPVVMFTDDLEIKAHSFADNGEISVDLHSASRVGKKDFGENQRHILQILKALDEKFQ